MHLFFHKDFLKRSNKTFSYNFYSFLYFKHLIIEYSMAVA